MSTFKGIVKEFPEIRVDYFRTIAGRTPPLAVFLSHVHSDHLTGLEALKAPFVYCSSATRELLLRLEKYPHRMNFAEGILETRKQHYKHLRNLLKPIPLNAPTEIELRLGSSIRVTLLDANHCVGAVMFLIEDAVQAVLYTGDIRAEPWFVNALIRNPVVIPYTHGHRKLDKIYLDTTFAAKNEYFRAFPTKAEGLKELLTKVMRYPKETVFHFHAWTPGYEEVWIALALALRSQIHVDRYKKELYGSLAPAPSGTISSSEGQVLCGFKYGNRAQEGCLTSKHAVRIHSCELGTLCPTLEQSDVVWITPIISRSEGAIILEVGADGGEGDLTQAHELELSDPRAALELMRLCLSTIPDTLAREKTLSFLSSTLSSHKKSISLDLLGLADCDDSIPLERLTALLAELADREKSFDWKVRDAHNMATGSKAMKSRKSYGSSQKLPTSIQFPYSRHSSYNELCDLVAAFKPVDVYPCTVDDDGWNWEVSICSLFGHLCSGNIFSHDKEMSLLKGEEIGSHTTKRQIVKLNPQDDICSQPTGNIDSDQKHEQDAILARFVRTNEIHINMQIASDPRQLPRKRSRTTREPIGRANQSPSQLTTSPKKAPLKGDYVSRHCPNISKKGITSKSVAPSATFFRTPSDNIKSSFEGWLTSPKSQVEPLAPGDDDRSIYIAGEPSVIASTSTTDLADEPQESRFHAEPPLQGNDERKDFQCRWQTCNKVFDLLAGLRQHIILDHRSLITTSGSPRYKCLWGRCSMLKAPAFESKSSWKYHLHKAHGLHKMVEKIIEHDRSDSTPFQIPEARSCTDIRGKDKKLHPDVRPSLSGTQAYPLSFSSQETTASAPSSSLVPQTPPRPDGLGSESSTGIAHNSQDSQLSLPTSAFESQEPPQTQTGDQEDDAKYYRLNVEAQSSSMKHRKAAYRAAKGVKGSGWSEVDLVTSKGGHGECELEL